MPLFKRSAEDLIKEIVKEAKRVKEKVDKGKYDDAANILKIIVGIDKRLYDRVREETRSEEMYKRCLEIRDLAEEAIKESQDFHQFEKLKATIDAIIRSGERFLYSDERFVGFSIEKKDLDFMRQARLLSDYVEGLTVVQAAMILAIGYTYGFDIVIGGSSLKNNRLGGDLDLGFKPAREPINAAYMENIRDIVVPRIKELKAVKIEKLDENFFKNLIDTINSNVNAIEKKDRVKTAINKINKFAFKRFDHKFGPRPASVQAESGPETGFRPIVTDHFIYDGYKNTELAGIGDIWDVRDFFFRRGFRKDFHTALDKDGRPFGPSGYLYFKTDGTTIIALPRYRKETVVGESVFWR